VGAHSQRQFDWQMMDSHGEESLVVMAHMGYELLVMMMTAHAQFTVFF